MIKLGKTLERENKIGAQSVEEINRECRELEAELGLNTVLYYEGDRNRPFIIKDNEHCIMRVLEQEEIDKVVEDSGADWLFQREARKNDDDMLIISPAKAKLAPYAKLRMREIKDIDERNELLHIGYFKFLENKYLDDEIVRLNVDEVPSNHVINFLNMDKPPIHIEFINSKGELKFIVRLGYITMEDDDTAVYNYTLI